MKTHVILRGLLFLALAVASSPWVHAQNSQPVTAQIQPSSQQAAPPSPSAAPLIPSYPDTAKGLESLMKDMLKLSKGKDHDEMARYAKSLVLPDPVNWFKSVFGDELGVQFASATERARAEIEASALDTLSAYIHEKQSNIKVYRFVDPCNEEASAVEYPVLILRKQPVPLYDVRFSGGASTSSWFYFAFVDGAFRFVGPLRKEIAVHKSQSTSSNSTTSDRIQVGGEIAPARIVHFVPPEYPRGALATGLPGKVTLHMIISKEGMPDEIDVLEGQCPFVKPAIDTVRQWRYQPAMLNGHPVEVETTTTVTFSIAGRH